MDDFSAAPGVQNAYGLIGSEANAIAPGKKPLSSMTPTVVLDETGQVVMVIGASGGSTIISATIQVFLNIVEFGMNPQEAVAAPRIHHQWIPEALVLEPEFPEDVTRTLQQRGHTLKRMRAYSSVQVTMHTDLGIMAGADPRRRNPGIDTIPGRGALGNRAVFREVISTSFGVQQHRFGPQSAQLHERRDVRTSLHSIPVRHRIGIHLRTRLRHRWYQWLW